MEREFQKVTIVGVGLIGGSLALDLKARKLAGEIIGVGRSRENLELARSRGIIDRMEQDPERGVEGSDLVILAAPVGSLVPLARRLGPALKAGAVLSDVGSVKAPIVREIEATLAGRVAFVGGHPLAGTEKGGAGAAESGLFAGRRVILTPTAQTDPAALKAVRRLWEEVGALVSLLEPEAHDAILAAVSHLPHVVSASLVQAVFRRFPPEEIKLTAAGSFRDLSRVTSSPPELWRDILSLNREAVLAVLSDFRAAFTELETSIRDNRPDRILEFFRKAKRSRDEL